MSIESEDDEAPDPAEVELYSYRDKPIRDMTIWELFTGLVGAAQMSLPERDRDSDVDEDGVGEFAARIADELTESTSHRSKFPYEMLRLERERCLKVLATVCECSGAGTCAACKGANAIREHSQELSGPWD